MSENKKLIPKRRFEEFQNADAWEQLELVEVLDLLKDGTHGTHRDVEQGIYLLSAKNIKNGEILIDVTDRIISVEDYNAIHKSFQLENGDVLLTIVGSIGETAILVNKGDYTFQRSVAYLRPNKYLTSQFLFTTIESINFQRELRNRQVISAQPGIYLGDLSVIPVKIPQIDEQEKIGHFFQNLDQTIAFQQRKLEKMKSMKSAYLSEMFPSAGERKPKRRFPGFTDAWEQRELGETILRSIKGKAQAGMIGTESVYLETNYLNGGEKTYVNSPSDVQEDDILILWDGSKAGTVYHGFKGALGSTLKAYRAIESGSFLYQQLKKNQQLIYDNYRTPNIPHVVKNFTEEFKILIPSFDEQEKIGSFFQNLDQTIAFQQQKLEKLQNIKKAYLNEMFI